VGFKCGIVGLPNVGKSTIFNAITQSQKAAAANYPFCTIDPNIDSVPVPDARLERLVALNKPQRVIPAQMQFVDIAGLVKGAADNQGLGNKFLSHIRDVEAIAHVVRCFDDPDIIHVMNTVDPVRDIEIITTELAIKDMESVDARIDKQEKLARSGDKKAQAQAEFLKRVRAWLDQGKAARLMPLSDDERALIDGEMRLLTAKPVLYVANVHESDLPKGNKHVEAVRAYAKAEGSGCIMLSGKIESEIALLPEAERKDFLQGLGLEHSGLDEMIRAGYTLLGLRTYFTAGPKEVRAWTIHVGDTAPVAAGKIHTDFQRGFICAETISFADYDKHAGEAGARAHGRMRTEGKEYVVQDGDVMLFRFNV
jgi:hypothetical protein